MSATTAKLKICPKGHKFYKSSDCPTCPICEKEKKPAAGFLSLISAPARRALERENISSLAQLSRWNEKDLLQLHGIGQNGIEKLKQALKEEGFSFAQNKTVK